MTSFLAKPGSDGPVGALMDEYARAAEDFCRVVEGFAQERFDEERESDDSDTVSARSICRHVCGAAHGYANYLRNALGIEMVNPEIRFETPAAVRAALARELRFTEESAEPLRTMTDDAVIALEWKSRWGSTYGPESMLEHAICHVLRHRRQLARLRA